MPLHVFMCFSDAAPWSFRNFYRSIAPPKERRRHVWKCPFHWTTVFATLQSDKIDSVITHTPSPIFRTDRINLEPFFCANSEAVLCFQFEELHKKPCEMNCQHGQVAVHSLSFGLALGECFAFLGTNGVSWNQNRGRKWKLYIQSGPLNVTSTWWSSCHNSYFERASSHADHVRIGFSAESNICCMKSCVVCLPWHWPKQCSSNISCALWHSARRWA